MLRRRFRRESACADSLTEMVILILENEVYSARTTRVHATWTPWYRSAAWPSDCVSEVLAQPIPEKPLSAAWIIGYE